MTNSSSLAIFSTGDAVMAPVLIFLESTGGMDRSSSPATARQRDGEERGYFDEQNMPYDGERGFGELARAEGMRRRGSHY